MTEDNIQISLVLWLRKNYPDLFFYHCPNGGSRHGGEAVKFKRMGVMPGIPDLVFPSLHLYLELKTETGRLSKAQKEVMAKLSDYDYICEVAYGFEQAKKIVLKYVDI